MKTITKPRIDMENSISNSQHKLFGLDHLRALAILLVLLFHYQLNFSHPSWTEWFKHAH